MERTAYAIIPLAEPGKRIAKVTYREDGYTPTVYDDPLFTQDDAEHIVAELNAAKGVTPAVALAMLAGSMFGWHVPAAEPAIVHFSLLGSGETPDE
jgi:hypothetical protein